MAVAPGAYRPPGRRLSGGCRPKGIFRLLGRWPGRRRVRIHLAVNVADDRFLDRSRRMAELPNATAHGATELGQLAGTEDDQNDGEKADQEDRMYVEGHCKPPPSECVGDRGP
jgi:hypothetical protein